MPPKDVGQLRGLQATNKVRSVGWLQQTGAAPMPPKHVGQLRSVKCTTYMGSAPLAWCVRVCQQQWHKQDNSSPSTAEHTHPLPGAVPTHLLLVKRLCTVGKCLLCQLPAAQLERHAQRVAVLANLQPAGRIAALKRAELR